MVISPYAKTGYIDHQTLSSDAYLKFIEDDFLGGSRLNPKTDRRPDPRPDVREDEKILGNMVNDFDFNQTPRAAGPAPDQPPHGLAEHSGLLQRSGAVRRVHSDATQHLTPYFGPEVGAAHDRPTCAEAGRDSPRRARARVPRPNPRHRLISGRSPAGNSRKHFARQEPSRIQRTSSRALPPMLTVGQRFSFRHSAGVAQNARSTSA